MSAPLYATPKVEVIFTNNFAIGEPMVIGEGLIAQDFLSDAGGIAELSNVVAIDIRRGRDRLLDSYNSGSATVVVRDENADLNPLSPTSPYYEYGLNPGRIVRISADDNVNQVSLVDDEGNEFLQDTNSSAVVGMFSPLPGANEDLDVRLAFRGSPQWQQFVSAYPAQALSDDGTFSWTLDFPSVVSVGGEINIRPTVTLYFDGYGYTWSTDSTLSPPGLPAIQDGEVVLLRFWWTPDDYNCTLYYRISTPGMLSYALDSDTGWIVLPTIYSAGVGAPNIATGYANALGEFDSNTNTILVVGGGSEYGWTDFGRTWFELDGAFLGAHILANATTVSRCLPDNFGAATTNTRTNVVTNPSFETNTTGWTGSAAATLGRTTTYSLYGSYGMSMLKSTAGTGNYGVTTSVTVTGTGYHSIGIYYFPVTTTRDLKIDIGWKNSGGGTISTATKTVLAASQASNSWQLLTLSTSAPVGTVTADIVLTVLSGLQNEQYIFDGAFAIKENYNLGYFDGSLTHAVWNGTANASSSTQTCDKWLDDQSQTYIAIGQQNDVESSAYTYYLFSGYITGFQYDWTPGQKGCYVTITAEDLFRQLNMSKIDAIATAAVGDLPGERITQVLETLGYPTYFALIGDGDTVLQDDSGAERSALSALQLVEESDLGAFYIDTRGRVVYEGRSDTIEKIASNPVELTDATPGTGLSYQQIRVSYDDELVNNDVRITPEGLTEQSATDVDSIARYFNKSFVRSGLLMDDETDALYMAQTIAAGRAEPDVRVEALGFDITKDPNLWAIVVSLDINNPIQVTKDWIQEGPGIPVIGGGTDLGASLAVQGVSHSIRPNRWFVTVNTAEVLVTGFILNSTLWGELDDDIIAY